MVQLLEKKKVNIDEFIKNCPRFQTCEKLDCLYDSDMLDVQLAEGIRSVCGKCLRERFGLE